MDANEKRRRAEDKRAGVFADELAKIRRRRAALEAKETRLLADAYALTLEQRSRVGSASSRGVGHAPAVDGARAGDGRAGQ